MRLIATTMAVAMGAAAMADSNPGTLVLWDFNGPSASEVPGGPSSPTPAIGTGTASLLGGVTGGFASGIVNGGSSDPVNTNPPNLGWQTTTYAPQGTQNLERGVQFMVSTEGWDKIVVSWDHRHSNTSSRFVQFLYTLDGGATWTNAGLDNDGLFIGPSGDTWFNGRTVDLSAVEGASDNPDFGFRIVATFAPETNAYAASNATSTYGPAGTWRFDMVQVKGNELPRPPDCIAADLNCDGIVDGNDLGTLLGFWGPCPAPCPADLNGDGVVDGGDLGELLGLWS